MKINFIRNLLNPCLIIFTSIMAMPAVLHSQTTQTIQLEQAIQMGFESSKQMMIAKGKLDYAQAKHDQAYDLQYPATKLSAAYSRLSDVPDFAINGEVVFPVFQNSFQNRVSLNEVIFAGFRVKTYKEAAEKNLSASQYDFEKDKQDIKLNIISAYYNLYKVQQSISTIDASLKVIDQRVADIQNLEKNGLATYNDVLRVQLQQSNIELLNIDATNILQSANYNFNLLIGLPGNVSIVLDTTGLFATRNIGSSDAYLSNALINRPELQSLAMRNKVAEDNLKFTRNSYWPTVNANGNFYYANPNQRYVPPENVFHSTWDVGVALNWDITNLFTNKHVIAESKALLDQSLASTEQLSDAVKSEVFLNYLSYNEALEKLKVLKKAVEQSEENLRVTDSRYRNNLSIVSDLTDAQTLQLQSAINLIIAKADAQISYFKLLKSSGNFN